MPAPKRIKKHRLHAWWSKREKCMMAQIEPRVGNAANYFAFRIFNEEIIAELKERGYDMSTLKFQIDRSKRYIRKYNKERQA